MVVKVLKEKAFVSFKVLFPYITKIHQMFANSI